MMMNWYNENCTDWLVCNRAKRIWNIASTNNIGFNHFCCGFHRCWNQTDTMNFNKWSSQIRNTHSTYMYMWCGDDGSSSKTIEMATLQHQPEKAATPPAVTDGFSQSLFYFQTTVKSIGCIDHYNINPSKDRKFAVFNRYRMRKS